MPVIPGLKRAEATGGYSLAHSVSKIKNPKHLQILYLTKDLHLKYIKICFHLMKITQPKIGKGVREMANGHRKRCTISLVITERQLECKTKTSLTTK